MALITQTNEIVGTALSGIGSYQSYGQAVFSIGWDYVFAAMNPNQVIGTLIKVDPLTGAPLQVLKTNHNIQNGFPYTNSWNSGNTMVSTTVDGVQYLYVRYKAWNPKNIYRAIWDEQLLQFKDFSLFSVMSFDIQGNNYNNMARLTDDVIRIMSQTPSVCDFDIRTGDEIRSHAVNGGTWSPSSYPYANSFSPLDDPTMIIGASGDGANWYVEAAYLLPVSFNPNAPNPYADGFNTVGTVHMIHPSTHHDVSYYTPNNGTITAYRNKGVYIQKNKTEETSGRAFVKKNGIWLQLYE